MGLKKKDTGLHEDLDKIFDENKSDRPSILSGAASGNGGKIGGRRKKARLTTEERRYMHPVQTYLNDEEWKRLKVKLVTEGLVQEEFLYQAVLKAIDGK